MFLGFDPGKDKCGVAVMGSDRYVHYHQVVSSVEVLTTINSLCQKYSIDVVIMGNQTTSKIWEKQLINVLPNAIKIIKVDERYSSLEARDRYWQMYPPKGLSLLIPQGMRVPPRPVDDIVAIVLIERWLMANQ